MSCFTASHRPNARHFDFIYKSALFSLRRFIDIFQHLTSSQDIRTKMMVGGAPKCESCNKTAYHAEQVMGPGRKVRNPTPAEQFYTDYE